MDGAQGSIEELTIAPEDPGFYRDAGPACRWLHDVAPVYWHEAQDLWVISKWEDIRYVSRSPELFCSSQGTLLRRPKGDGAPRPAPPSNVDGRLVGPSLLEMDPPMHGRYRQLVSRAFTTKMVASLEPRIRAIAQQSIDSVLGETADFVEYLAAPLPLLIIAEMLGIPGEDIGEFKRWTDAIASSTNRDPTIATEMFDYLEHQLDLREGRPREDLLSGLLSAQVDTDRLSRPDILRTVSFLLVAGNETTRSLIAGGARALMEHPEQKAKLLAEPEQIRNGVEEMLRWVTPVRWFGRTAAGDQVIRGQRIADGDYLLLLYLAGNRDSEVWLEPYAFDVTRPPSQHVSFGHAEHLCIGTGLARLEARVMFEELLLRCPDLTLAGEVQLMDSALLNCTESMPVTFAAR